MNNIWGNIFGSNKTKGFALVVAAGATIGAPITLANEGVRLQPYYDSAHVRTVCAGETHAVEERAYTKDECINQFEIQYGYYSYATARFYGPKAQTVLTPKIHAAMTDMSYNVGLGAIEKSYMIHELNDGNAAAACKEILNYKKAGGEDCSNRKSDCYGIWVRRVNINKMCMEGVKDGPSL